MAKVVTITNPVTGQPEQVDQLDHTAQQIDDAVAAARWSHRNLLDNAYFANPDAIIDQRGGYVVPPGTAYYSDTGLTTQAGAVSAYTKAAKVNSTYGTIAVSGTTYYVAWSAAVRGYVGAGYTIDRWRTYVKGTVLITDDGVHLIDTIDWGTQIELNRVPINTPVTLSVLTNQGIGTVTHTFSGVVNEQIYVDVGNGVKVNAIYNWDNSNTFLFCLQAVDSVVNGAKLELGDKQTLAHQDEDGNWVLNDPPPDKGMELLKCIQSTADPGDGYANKVVLHTGNKPSGSYTGNGSAAARTINTGGIGNALIVYSTTHTFVLSPYGGFSIVNGQGTVSGIPASVANFSNGILTITSATTLNVSSGIYYYQVL